MSVQKNHSDEMKSLSVESKMELNDLVYKPMPDVNEVAKRSQIRNYPSKQSYTGGETMTLILNSGSSYVNGKNSTLNFDVSIANGAPNAYFGCGSACNFFSIVRFTSQSGVELEACFDLNNLRPVIDRYVEPKEWFQTVGQCMGYANPSVTTDAAGAVVAPTNIDLKNVANKRTFCIPMSKIFELFNTDKPLIGLGLISGARIDIILEAPVTALMWTGGAGGAGQYTLNNVVCVLDCIEANDGILSALTEESAKKGLAYHFNSYDRNITSTTDVRIQLNSQNATSKAIMAVAKTRLTNNLSIPGVDSFLGFSDTKNYIFRLGQLTFPLAPINAGLIDKLEMYNQALYVWGKHRTSLQPSCVTYQSFRGFAEGADAAIAAGPLYAACDSVAVVDLERSVCDLSGLPLSGSRVLSLSAELNAAPGGGVTVTLYTLYAKLARVYPDRIVLRV